ncbi:hypothetical protein CRG98_027281 [Punica granatum]|uniref:Uncharacterized protein n=1 Tax=Punica granatum TaxID=22663 RepID=A0A2I0J7Y9_PUNGR|nr:hypothetical protein CRG98_027281 [Punica granatum]
MEVASLPPHSLRQCFSACFFTVTPAELVFVLFIGALDGDWISYSVSFSDSPRFFPLHSFEECVSVLRAAVLQV